MSEIWVVNASPVITLAAVDHLHLLTELSGEVHLPKAVSRELLAGSSSDAARRAVLDGWGLRAFADEPVPNRILEWGLGAGESSVLAAVLETEGAVAVIDDAEARKCASTLGVSMIGTLGVIIRAKLRGLIPSAVELLKAVRGAGLYLDSTTIKKALLATTGEEWRV